MSKKDETLFKERVSRDLEQVPNCYFVKIQQVAKRGTPDFFLCVLGHFIAIELKKSRKAPIAPLQIWTLEKIVQANGMGFVVYPENWAETYATIQELAKLKDYPEGTFET